MPREQTAEDTVRALQDEATRPPTA